MIFEIDEEFLLEEIFGFERIIKKNFYEDELFLDTIVNNLITVLIKATDQDILYDKINIIKNTFKSYYNKEITVSISSSKSFDKIHILYKEAIELLKYKFYLGK